MQNLNLILVAFLVGCTSCATIFNSKYSKVDIHTNEPAILLINGDTIHSDDEVIRISLLNQKQIVDLHLKTDSSSKIIGLHPQNSLPFKMNFLLGYGAGYIIDANHPKRYSYPRSIIVDMSDEKEVYQLYFLPVKNDFYLKISAPLVNSFLFKPPEINEFKTSYGFWGVGAELEYFYKNKRSFRLSWSFVDNNTLFQTEQNNIFRIRNRMRTFNLYYSHQHQINRFSTGYGFSYVHNIYESYDEFDPLSSIIRTTVRNYKAFGVVFPLHAQLSERLYLGLTYCPTFVQIYKRNTGLAFEHLLSTDIAWRFRLN